MGWWIASGLISALVTWLAWGMFNPIPTVSDEQSYVLQSRIFATGHWTAPSPPIPQFFEQSHVLTAPAVASKFPPGHALLLSIGTLLGSPVIASLALTALTGALLLLLVARVTNVWVAALTFAIWLSDPINLRFRPGYFSEVTTQALWLLSWWSLLEWTEKRNRRWLLTLAAAIGWGAITRPLTMLAFAVPVGIVVIRDVVRLRLWRDLGSAVLLGVTILAVIPLWSAETTGSWRQTPLTLYRRDYLPFDKPGFGFDTTPPLLPLNPVNRSTYVEFSREHIGHTPRSLPSIAWDRLRVIAISEWRSRLVFVPFAVLGLFCLTVEMTFALICALALFVAYLSYGHFSEWTLYYFEGIPILSMVTAVGLWRSIERTAGRFRVALWEPRAALLVLVPLAAVTAHEVSIARANHLDAARWNTEFDGMIAALPKHPTVIFVHFTPGVQPHPNVVRNSPNLADEPIWIVNDLGDRDRELMRYAGPRVPLHFFEDGRRFELARDLLKR